MSCEHHTSTGEAEAEHPAATVSDVGWVGVICLVSVRLGQEVAETVQATTLELVV
jgi:hypothetical protein